MLKRLPRFIKYISACFAALLCSCIKDKGIRDLTYSGYPQEVGKIILNKCAVSGCHNTISQNAAGNICLMSWRDLFSGNNRGAVVIPYRPDYSTLCYYINTDSSKGPALSPTMPLNKEPLSAGEYEVIRKWILKGAPDHTGYVKFSDDPKRKKIYVSNQLCDVVTVFDSQTLLPMRYINVGNKPEQELPFRIKMAPNGEYWLVSFFSPAGLIQKFDAKTDELTGQIELGPGAWSTFDICPDSKTAYVVGSNNPGQLAWINLENMSLKNIFTFGNNLLSPRGALIDHSKSKIYLGTDNGNFIYVINIADANNPVMSKKPVDGTQTVQHAHLVDPGSFVKTNDDQFCFVSGEYSSQVRMLDLNKDSLVATFGLPAFAQQMDIYEAAHLLFIACPEDQISFPGHRGSVVVVDYLSKTIVKKINAGYQPYGLAVDKSKKVVAVSNANLNSEGPSPHHSNGCGGRNGYVTFIDLNTLALLDKKTEVAVFPRNVAVRK